MFQLGSCPLAISDIRQGYTNSLSNWFQLINSCKKKILMLSGYLIFEPPRHGGDSSDFPFFSNHSSMVMVCMTSAWIEWSSSARMLLTIRCRVNSIFPLNSSETMVTLKWDSDPSDTLCLWLSLITSRNCGCNDRSLSSIEFFIFIIWLICVFRNGVHGYDSILHRIVA